MPDLDTLDREAIAAGRFCPHEHTVHSDFESDPKSYTMWVTCDTPDGVVELARVERPRTSWDDTEAIRYFVADTQRRHQQRAATDIILALLDRT